MRTVGIVTAMVATWAAAALLSAGALAEPGQPGPTATSQETIVVAQAKAAPAAVKEPAEAADTAALSERLGSLEKENLVLREDLGKARLDARAQLEAAAKRQAEAIARLSKELADTQAKLEAEQAARARQNRTLWMAVGIVAIGVLLSN